MPRHIKVKLVDKEKLIFALEEDAQKGDEVALMDSSTVNFQDFLKGVNDRAQALTDANITHRIAQAEQQAVNNFKSSTQYLDLIKKTSQYEEEIKNFALKKAQIETNAINEYKKQQEYLNLIQEVNDLKQSVVILKQEKVNAINNYKSSDEYISLLKTEATLKQKINEFELLQKNVKQEAINEFKNSAEFLELNKVTETLKTQNLTLKNEINHTLDNFKASKEYLELIQAKTELKNQAALFKAQEINLQNQAIEAYKNSDDYLKLVEQNQNLNLLNVNLKQTIENLKIQMNLKIDNEVLKAKESAVIAYKQTPEYQELLEKVKTQETEIERLNYLHGGKNVKLIGEELEQYIFSKYQDYFGFNNDSSLEKTNDLVENTKPDFLFTVFDVQTNDNGTTKIPYGTVIIEAKNETLDAKNKHKNIDYLPKLSSDMQKRKADFGVLVTTLERDQQFSIYMDNNFKNIFIVRPDWLYPLLNLLKVIFLKRKEINRLNLSLKTSKDLIDEFEEFKNNILNNSFKNMQLNLDTIGESAQKIMDQANKILEAKDKIVTKHMNAMKNNITKFKINNFVKKLDAINEAKLIANQNGDLKELVPEDLIKLENKN